MAKFREATTVVISPPAIPGLGNSGGFSFVLQEREAQGGDVRGFDNNFRAFLGAIRRRSELSSAFSFFTANKHAGLPARHRLRSRFSV